MSAPAASRRPVLADDRAALAAGAAPGVADPVQPVTAQLGVVIAEPDGAYSDVVRVNYGPDPLKTWRDGVRAAGERHMATKYPAPPVTRQCLSCGVVAECDPALPCGVCSASPFHLIPLPPTQ